MGKVGKGTHLPSLCAASGMDSDTVGRIKDCHWAVDRLPKPNMPNKAMKDLGWTASCNGEENAPKTDQLPSCGLQARSGFPAKG